MASRLGEERGLLAVEMFGDGGEFMLERDGLIDRRQTIRSCEMREPVAQRQHAGLRGPRQGRGAVRDSIACVHLRLHQCLAMRRGTVAARYAMKRSEIAV